MGGFAPLTSAKKYPSRAGRRGEEVEPLPEAGRRPPRPETRAARRTARSLGQRVQSRDRAQQSNSQPRLLAAASAVPSNDGSKEITPLLSQGGLHRV